MSMSAYMPVTRESLEPSEFIAMSESEKKNIKKARFVPPKIGREGYGSFDVEYISPKLVKENVPAF